MSQKRGIAWSFTQSPQHYILGIGYLINSIPVMQNPDSVDQTTENIIQFFNIIYKSIAFYLNPLPDNTLIT